MLLATACGDGPGREPCQEDTFQRCVCADGRDGTAQCTGGEWSACECGPLPDAGTDDGAIEDGGACPPISCRAIDLLFVVDNSISMVPMQANLERNFERFADRLDALLPSSDIHVMVVDSDATGYEGSICEGPCPGPTPCEGYQCGAVAERGECDTALGGGVVHPIGDEASNEACLFPDGQRWVSRSDSYFTDAVRCAARVGASGNGEEQPLGAMLAALDQTGEGECNDGFLRPQALLAVVLITDASPGTSMEVAGSMDPFYEGLLDLKCGNEEAVAFLGFIHGADATIPTDIGVDASARCATDPSGPCCELCNRSGPSSTECQLCFETEEGLEPSCWTYFSGPASPLEGLIDRFGERGFQASVCTDDYGPAFEDAVDLIDRACTLI